MSDLRTFYCDVYAPLALRSRRPNTLRLYVATLNSFDRFLGRKSRTTDLNDITVSRFAAWRAAAGLSKFTINKDLFNLLAVWRWSHKKGYVTNWPDVQLERTPQRAPVALLREEIEDVMRAIGQQKGTIGRHLAQDWWQALVLLIWDTGERISAVLALEWREIDLARRWVRFPAETRKGGTQDNQLRIAGDTSKAIAKLSPREGKVFDWPYHQSYLYRKFAKVMQDAGLPDDHLHKFHCLRKSVASHYEAAGGNATELLGHSSRKVTMAYLDLRIVSPKPAIDLLFRPGERRE